MKSLRHLFRPGCPLALALVALSLTADASAQITETDNHKVIFRYRTFSGTRPDYVSPLTSTGNISYAAGSTDIVAIDRGAGFEDTLVTDFDGGSEAIQGASAIDTTDSVGDDSFAVEAWFKADTVSGLRSLFSNTENYRGFALRLNNGRLQGLVRFQNGSSSVSVYVDQEAAYSNLATGVWYYAVLHCRRTTSSYELRLYLDGVRVAYITSPLYDGVYQCAELPMVGAEPSGGVATGDYFDGQIYAVAVSNHDIYLDNYVKVPVARDAGRYFGAPSYHDYLSTTASVDFRIQSTCKLYPNADPTSASNKVGERILLPFLNDGYVPQGLGCDAATGRLYISYYWKDNNGDEGSLNANADKISLVAEIDSNTRALRRAFRLYRPNGEPNYGHVGGLEYHNGSLYVSYGTSIYRYPLSSAPNPSYIFNPQTFANARADQNPLTVATSYPLSGLLQGNTANSALHISTDTNGDTLLWTTEHSTTAYKKLLGFRINADGSLATPAIYAFTLPVTKVNGVACYHTTSTEFYFYLATSYGDTASVWKRVRYLKSSATAQSTTTVFTGPAGNQNLTLKGSQVWSLSESGARYYQKRTDGNTPWEDLYPFVFSVTP